MSLKDDARSTAVARNLLQAMAHLARSESSFREGDMASARRELEGMRRCVGVMDRARRADGSAPEWAAAAPRLAWLGERAARVERSLGSN